MPRISAVVIALNESHRIGAAVASVAPWVDEVFVLDGGSTDDTLVGARDACARVERAPFDGFVSQKQRATNRAAHDLVFSLDADERVDIELGASLRLAARGGLAGWSVRRMNYLDGVPLRASGWYPDRRVRLFDRTRARWGGSDPHDLVLVDGPVGRLPGHLHHDPERTLDAFVAATRSHAERRARSLVEEGVRPGPVTPWLHGGAHLLRKLTVGAAWLDGRRGLQVAWVGAGGVVAKYQRAAELGEVQA